MKFSFIIPAKSINKYAHEAIGEILKIEREDFEIIICPNKQEQVSWPRTIQIASGRVGPAAKRNLAAQKAQGDILVFLDDDSFPRKDFLDIIENDFENQNLTAVGGPAITAPGNSFWQRVSGAVHLSLFSGGFPERFSQVEEEIEIDDWPTVNFSIRKDHFWKIGGFDCEYWPGEDTKLCLEIKRKLGGNIVYNPEALVFHHRRKNIWDHLKQVGGYGLHRGYFAKKYPQTSLRLKYFLPTFLVLYLIFGLFFPLLPGVFQILYLLGLAVYAAAIVKATFDIKKIEKNLAVTFCSVLYIVPTHIFYGLRFVQGLVFTRELKSKLK